MGEFVRDVNEVTDELWGKNVSPNLDSWVMKQTTLSIPGYVTNAEFEKIRKTFVLTPTSIGFHNEPGDYYSTFRTPALRDTHVVVNSTTILLRYLEAVYVKPDGRRVIVFYDVDLPPVTVDFYYSIIDGVVTRQIVEVLG